MVKISCKSNNFKFKKLKFRGLKIDKAPKYTEWRTLRLKLVKGIIILNRVDSWAVREAARQQGTT